MKKLGNKRPNGIDLAPELMLVRRDRGRKNTQEQKTRVWKIDKITSQK